MSSSFIVLHYYYFIFSSLVIRDLTLRSASSFGSFHLLRLLYDEYMFFVVEHSIARATGTSSIAVMGEVSIYLTYHLLILKC